MRYTGPGATEETLRKENEDLRRQLDELKSHHSGMPARLWHPSSLTIWSIALGAAALIGLAFFAGFIPLQKRQALIVEEENDREHSVPRVEVIQVGRSPRNSELELPGSIQAITEAPILARADGYVLRRTADIGDHVQAGQVLAEIEAPEMDDQVRQAKANLQQTQAALDQAQANLAQGKSELELSRVTAQRWSNLAARGVVSKQENDQYQAQYQSKAAAVQSLERAVAVQRANIAAAEATLARIDKLQGYRVVRAPFAGVVTQRNVDTGALVNAGATLLFRIAQTGTLRINVNVPQSHANSVHPGQPAVIRVSNLPARSFTGSVARTANALDPASRTLLAEIHVANPDGALFPGMYAQVDLSSVRDNPPLLVRSDALIVGSAGTSVAVVRPDHTVHVQRIVVGRDYGDRLEVLSGLNEGDTIVPNPGDVAREGLKVDPVPLTEKK